MHRTLLVLSALATPAAAEDPMTAAAFDAYTRGQTMTFQLQSGVTHGVESYLPDQRVIWSPAPGVCTQGRWFARDGDICFVYEDDPEPKCWQVFQTTNGIRAEYTTRPDSSPIFEARRSREPLICPGPVPLS